jgi:hypothetical protein
MPRGVRGSCSHLPAPVDRFHAPEPLDPIAGFVLEAESNVLRNADDDHERVVFDPAIRGRTDQVVLKFRKPRELAAR